MKVLLSRIDERLIHGQVLVSWIKQLALEQIIVIDNRLSGDQLMQSVMQVTVPQRIGVVFLSAKDALEYLKREDMGIGKNTLLLFRDIYTVYELEKGGYHLNSLNVGFMGARASRRKLTEYVYASHEEIELFQQLMKAGTDIYVQVVYAENRIPMASIIR